MEAIKGNYLPHQVEAIRWLVSMETGAILADEPGMGKTVVTIGLFLEKPVRTTLIIAPKSVVPQWESEIRKFSDLSVSVVDKRAPPSGQFPDVCLASYSVLKRLPDDLLPWLFQIKWDRVVCDEAHAMKNGSSQTFLNAMRLQADCRIALTGTPIQNKSADLISLAQWIRYQGPMHDLQDMCRRIVLRRTMEDSFPMPDLDIRIHPVDFTPQEREVYDGMEAFAEQRINKTGMYMEVLEMILRCRQICIHPQLFIKGMRKKLSVECEGLADDLLSEDWVGSSTKIDEVCRLLSGHADKSIVFCSFVDEMELLTSNLSRVGIESLSFHGGLGSEAREEVLSRFRNDPSVRVLAVQIAAGGAGLNLQVASRVYVLSPHYNPMMEVQALGRCYRHGQSKPVQMIKLVMRDSIEERICEIQEKKLEIVSEALGDSRIFNRMSPSAVLTTADIRFLFNRSLKV